MKKILIFVTASLLLGSCIRDTGNYDYRDINVVSINVPSVVGVKLEPQTFRLDPQVTQSMAADLSNLEFVWKKSTTNMASAGASEDTLSTAPYIDIVIDPSAEKIDFTQYYWLYVKDKLTDVVYPANISLIITKPYDGAWMVLHEQGGAKLAGIEFESDGTTTLTLDAFARAGAPPLTGKPTGLGVARDMGVSNMPEYYITYGYGNYNLLYVFTDDPSSAGQYVQARGMAMARPIADMPQNKQLITGDVLSKFQMFHGNNVAVSMVADGIFYAGRSGLKLYEAKIASDLTANGQPYPYFSLAHKVAWITMLYDREGRRILAYNNNGNTIPSSGGSNPTAYNESENSVEVTDVNRPNIAEPSIINPIPDDREVIYIGNGPNTTANARGTLPIVLAIGVGGNETSYVYQFISPYNMFTNSISQLDRIWTFETPATLTENSVFASTCAYASRLFYATDNTLYTLDYSGGRSTPLYIHPSGGKIVKMKFAYHDVNTYDYSAYGVNVNTSLGMLIETGPDSSEFVVVNLSPSGMLSDDTSVRPATEVFTGFGRGVDIEFL